jgi:apolipoprotein N-acyltransferase
VTFKFAGLKKTFSFALLPGFLLALSCAGPISFGAVAWFALIPLLWASTSTKPLQAAISGFICGFIYFLCMLYWVVIVMTTYGHMEWWLSTATLILLVSYMSIYPALFGACLSWTNRCISPLWSAPVLWVALDFLRGKLFTGFPWHDLAYTQYKYPLLLQTADITGHFGVTFHIVLVNGIGFLLLKYFLAKPRTKFSKTLKMNLTVAASIIATVMIYNVVRYSTVSNTLALSKTIPVTVVQGNISQDQKWIPGKLEKTINTYINLSEEAIAAHQPSLLIWPETALPLYPMESNVFPFLIKKLNEKHTVNLLTGAPHRSNSLQKDGTDFFNSAFMLSMQGEREKLSENKYVVGRYDKQHLVPFGEYVPLRDFLPIPAPLVETIGDFTPGSFKGSLSSQDTRIGVLICYESIFPELAREQAKNNANLLVNITNDAWFGKSSAPWQHLSMAVFRAIETRKSLARAANTGISGFIDPLGRMTQLSPLFEACHRTLDVPLLEGSTLYTTFGHNFAPICLLLSGCIIIFVWRKKKS